MAQLGRTRPIFLLTDFGLRDAYVGQLRAVISGIAPASAVHDLSHDVSPYAIDEGAWLLETSMPYLPPGAVVMAVVDPGVGSPRRSIAVACGEVAYVGPDNGVLSGVFPEWMRRGRPASHDGERARPAAHELSDPRFHLRHISPTFHGRDIFAPVAAHLAGGLDIRLLGPPIADPTLLGPFCGEPQPDGSLRGRVVHIDQYGSAITTIHCSELFPAFSVQLRGQTVGRRVQTFSDAPLDSLFCHLDSGGFLAIAVNQGSAKERLGIERGDAVQVTRV